MKFSLFIILSGLILLTGCKRLYWYRVKIEKRKNNLVWVAIQNRSPDYLNTEFEAALLTESYRALEESGFHQTSKENSNCNFTIGMEVHNYRLTETGTAWVDYEYKLSFPKKSVNLWHKEDEVYLRRDSAEDIRHAMDLMRAAVRDLGDKTGK